MANIRQLESAMLRRMQEDEFEDLPLKGERLDSAFIKILAYIDWLRDQIDFSRGDDDLDG